MALAVTTPAPDLTGKPSKAELEAAFRAAYGKPSPVIVRTPNGTEGFTPGGLVEIDPATGVVAMVVLGRNREDCHACTGSLSVHYLKRTSSSFKPWGGVDDYGFTGNGFGAPPQWSIRHDLEDDPVLVIETGYTGQGCSSAQQDLVALTLDGAVLRASRIPVLFDNTDAYDRGDPKIATIEGEIHPLIKGKRFEVVFHGTQSLRLVYHRVYSAYVTKDHKPDGC